MKQAGNTVLNSLNERIQPIAKSAARSSLCFFRRLVLGVNRFEKPNLRLESDPPDLGGFFKFIAVCWLGHCWKSNVVNPAVGSSKRYVAMKLGDNFGF